MPSPTTTIQRRDLGDVVSEYALARSRDTFAGLQIMPIFNTALQSGNFPIIPVEQMLKPRSVKRAPRGGYNRGDWQFEQGNYACEEYGWEEVVDDSLAANYADYFTAESVSAMIATDVILREQEKRIQAAADTAASNAVGTKWSVAATATPRANVKAGIKKVSQETGIMPDTFVCTWQTFQNLLNTTEVLDATKYTNPLTMNGFEAQKQLIATYLGVSRVIVTNAISNSANEGATFAASQIWNDANGYLVVTNAGALDSSPAWGRSMLWTGDSPNNINVESYREDAVRGTVVRVRHYVDEKILNTTCMYRLTNLV